MGTNTSDKIQELSPKTIKWHNDIKEVFYQYPINDQKTIKKVFAEIDERYNETENFTNSPELLIKITKEIVTEKNLEKNNQSVFTLFNVIISKHGTNIEEFSTLIKGLPIKENTNEQLLNALRESDTLK